MLFVVFCGILTCTVYLHLSFWWRESSLFLLPCPLLPTGLTPPELCILENRLALWNCLPDANKAQSHLVAHNFVQVLGSGLPAKPERTPEHGMIYRGCCLLSTLFAFCATILLTA